MQDNERDKLLALIARAKEWVNKNYSFSTSKELSKLLGLLEDFQFFSQLAQDMEADTWNGLSVYFGEKRLEFRRSHVDPSVGWLEQEDTDALKEQFRSILLEQLKLKLPALYSSLLSELDSLTSKQTSEET